MDANVQVTVQDGVVTLTGKPDGNHRNLIEKKVLDMPGVSEVINEITTSSQVSA